MKFSPQNDLISRNPQCYFQAGHLSTESLSICNSVDSPTRFIGRGNIDNLASSTPRSPSGEFTSLVTSGSHNTPVSLSQQASRSTSLDSTE